MAAEPPAGAPDRRATFEFKSIVTSENGHVTVATDGRLETANAFLSAKMIRRDDRTGLIIAEGDVVYTTKELRILGARIMIDTRADVIEATDVRFPAGAGTELKPGESATFKCPFRALFGLPPLNEDYGVVQRSQIYFHASYELPFIGTIRLSDNSVPFFLNTRLLPPRWTSKPE